MAIQVSKHLEPWRDLKGKVVMVTGASSGLGQEVCLELAKAGCRIIAAARRVDRLNSLCEEINSSCIASHDDEAIKSARAVAVELDVSADGATIESSIQKAWQAFGRIDALLNNAGFRGGVKSALDLSEEEWNRVMKTNLTGAWLVSKYVCVRMRNANISGSVINISSVAGAHRGLLPGMVAYASSKAALNTITEVMALEFGEHKIRVNSISPGIFKSEITEGLMQKKWMKNVAMRTIPLRTFVTSDPALTSLVRYLIHDSSHYVSGNIFIVDGGFTLAGLPIFSSL
ncbi:hypothetical protein LWI29_004471 [Acer saccharum]|uniref:(21S)-21-acetoxyl-apo-melianone synthase SDR n=1 Tax=Acer saccharum TaxID=4024 RepID=A0AA39SQU5_ACESA|nr:hypothetical protein LWI29_004471 [Acer saccharum]